MCHPHRKIATINQLIKIDSSSIILILSYISDYTYILGYNFYHFIDHENIAPFVKFANKFEISKFAKSFQNLKNVDIVFFY